jgi:Glu-tRNA(Gln) amidotransferase subunit E-like FAD-binding protein
MAFLSIHLSRVVRFNRRGNEFGHSERVIASYTDNHAQPMASGYGVTSLQTAIGWELTENQVLGSEISDSAVSENLVWVFLDNSLLSL